MWHWIKRNQIPAAVGPVQAIIDHPLMKTFINKRVSEEKFRYFFESYSEQYGYDHATKEIIHIFIFVARFYNQGELVDFGCSLLKQQISSKMLFKCWQKSIALLACVIQLTGARCD